MINKFLRFICLRQMIVVWAEVIVLLVSFGASEFLVAIDYTFFFTRSTLRPNGVVLTSRQKWLKLTCERVFAEREKILDPALPSVNGCLTLGSVLEIMAQKDNFLFFLLILQFAFLWNTFWWMLQYCVTTLNFILQDSVVSKHAFQMPSQHLFVFCLIIFRLFHIFVFLSRLFVKNHCQHFFDK